MLEQFVARHVRSILLVACALVAAGAFAASSLPVGLFPDTSFPRVVVNLSAGSQPAQQTDLLVTRPVELAVRAVPGVRDVRASSTRGASQISIDFAWGADMVAATLEVDAAIAAVLPTLPPGTSYDVNRMTPSVYPIISYALISPTVSPVALRDLALYQITPLLASIPGLGRTDVQGGRVAEVEVLADPHRLALLGIGLPELAQAVSRATSYVLWGGWRTTTCSTLLSPTARLRRRRRSATSCSVLDRRA